MQRLSTAFLIIALVIVVNECDATVQYDSAADQLAQETKTPAIGVADFPKYVIPPEAVRLDKANQTWKPNSTTRPPSKPPILSPDKQRFFVDAPKHFYGQLPNLPPARHIFSSQPLKIHSNSVYNFPKVIPLPNSRSQYSVPTRQPLIFAATTSKSINTPKSPKFSLPVQTINGIRTDFVRPPKLANLTTVTTTTTIAPSVTTTRRILRTKRIWPKRILEKNNVTVQNETKTNSTWSNNTIDRETADSRHHYRYAYTEKTTTTTSEPTTRKYRRVTRAPSKRSTTPTPEFIKVEANDWVPIIPQHYRHTKTRRIPQTPMKRRSDIFFANPLDNSNDKGTLFLQSYGILPLADSSASPSTAPDSDRKNMVLFRKKKRPHHQPYLFPSPDLKPQESRDHPKVVTKTKHHHHHHHHRYIKTVEKKVPYKVEVPKPYPVEKKVPVTVPVEKIKIVDRPYPVPVEKKVPYPVPIKVPQPIPVRVVEKEYVPKPYPIVHRVPVVQKVEVKVPFPVQVEKKVPYPVHVKVPVDRPVAVPVHVEKRVPYPVPVKVLVPQPYPVETRVPYPVEVKVREPVEVIRHVQVRVPYPQPYPVKVREPYPVPVEKRVPYPVEVEKKVPVPYEVLVPHKVEVVKKFPVYVPQPYPVEKRVPYPVKVPYPVRVPVRVPVKVPIEIPVFIHQPYEILNDKESRRINDILAGDSSSHYEETSSPQHSAVHGNTGFSGFQSRSDTNSPETTTTTVTTTDVQTTTS